MLLTPINPKLILSVIHGLKDIYSAILVFCENVMLHITLNVSGQGYQVVKIYCLNMRYIYLFIPSF